MKWYQEGHDGKIDCMQKSKGTLLFFRYIATLQKSEGILQYDQRSLGRVTFDDSTIQ